MNAIPIEQAEIHITDISRFKKCRLRWHFSSNLRLNMEPDAPPRALWLGIGVHEGLAAYYDAYKVGGDMTDMCLSTFEEWVKASVEGIRLEYPALDTERLDAFTEDEDLGLGMLEHYCAWAPTVDDFEVIDTEQSISIPNFIHLEGKGMKVVDERGVRFLTSIGYKGRGDMLVRAKHDGEYWIYEHKTARTIETERLLLEEQPGVYQWAMSKKHDVPVVGTRFNFLRKKVPTVPAKVKDGSRFSAIKIDTTYEAYMAALVDAEFDPMDPTYLEVLEGLKAKGNTFFYREDVVRSQKELEILIGFLKAAGREMCQEPVIYPAPDFMACKMCPFQGPCIAMHDGSDWKYILQDRYRVRKPDAEVVGPELQDTASVL